MGRNLALNLEEKGNRVSVYNRSTEGEEHVVEEFISSEGTGKKIYGADSLSDFTASLEKPRKILMMVKAGKAVENVIDELLPHLDENDILIDGGNSQFEDTARRVEALTEQGIRFVGMGVSGGEEGARHGPSLMPGGNPEAWHDIRPILEPIAARSFDDLPCCPWIGSGGAGHFVKMVHNGIEYADMQLIAEAYHLMKTGLDMHALEISQQFQHWNDGSLASYLIEITSEIFAFEDADKEPLIDKILDSAGQKGTGKWTAISALENGLPLPGITESVFARYVSSLVKLRQLISEGPIVPNAPVTTDRNEVLRNLAEALLASRMMCHAEGFFFITRTGKQQNWNIDAATVARIWQGGCIIRSMLLKEIEQIYQDRPTLPHLLLSETYAGRLDELQTGWRKNLTFAINHGIPAPVSASSLSQYDALRFARLPANLIQAQRDYFGAHTYERLDSPRGDFFHTEWSKPKE